MQKAINSDPSGTGMVANTQYDSFLFTRNNSNATDFGSTTIQNHLYAQHAGSPYNIGRVLCPFDTRLIPKGSKILSAVLSFTVVFYIADGTIHAVRTNQTVPTQVIAADYGKVLIDSASLGTVDVSANGAKSIALNDLTVISPGRWTTLALITNQDKIDNIISDNYTDMKIDSPQLTIVFNPPGGAAMMALL